MKERFRLRSGYTQAVPVLIFISAVLVQARGGFAAGCVFGVMVSGVVGLAVPSGPSHPLYEALARGKDGPTRTYYIIVPHFATIIGGLAGSGSTRGWIAW